MVSAGRLMPNSVVKFEISQVLWQSYQPRVEVYLFQGRILKLTRMKRHTLLLVEGTHPVFLPVTKQVEVLQL